MASFLCTVSCFRFSNRPPTLLLVYPPTFVPNNPQIACDIACQIRLQHAFSDNPSKFILLTNRTHWYLTNLMVFMNSIIRWKAIRLLIFILHSFDYFLNFFLCFSLISYNFFSTSSFSQCLFIFFHYEAFRGFDFYCLCYLIFLSCLTMDYPFLLIPHQKTKLIQPTCLSCSLFAETTFSMKPY